MSESNKLVAAVRTEFGKGASRRARRNWQVPAVLYGHHTEPRHLLLGSLELAAILRRSGTNSILTLDIEGEEQLALTRQIDVHPITGGPPAGRDGLRRRADPRRPGGGDRDIFLRQDD